MFLLIITLGGAHGLVLLPAILPLVPFSDIRPYLIDEDKGGKATPVPTHLAGEVPEEGNPTIEMTPKSQPQTEKQQAGVIPEVGGTERENQAVVPVDNDASQSV